MNYYTVNYDPAKYKALLTFQMGDMFSKVMVTVYTRGGGFTALDFLIDKDCISNLRVPADNEVNMKYVCEYDFPDSTYSKSECQSEYKLVKRLNFYKDDVLILDKDMFSCAEYLVSVEIVGHEPQYSIERTPYR
jgi:hypothetical protein